jgi:hypothetical protein
MLRIHLMQQWYALSDPAMEGTLNEIVPRQEFAGLSLLGTVPDETTILAFRHRLEQHGLAQRLFEVVAAHLAGRNLFVKQGTIADARIDHASGSTKNAGRCRDPEMHQTRKGNQWHFGMKLHVGCDPDTGPLPTPTRVPKVVDSYTWLLSQYCVRTIWPIINCGAPEWALVRVTVVSRSPGPAFPRQDNAQVSLPLSRRAREAATTSQHPLHVILLSDD